MRLPKKERKKLEESKRLKAKDVKKVGEGNASPKKSFEASDNESNASSDDPKVTAHLEALPMTPTNWCADVEYDREVVSLLSLYERALRQLGYLRTLTYTSSEEEGHAVGFSINARKENQEIRRIVEFRSRVIHRSVKVPSNFRVEHVAPNSGRDLNAITFDTGLTAIEVPCQGAAVLAANQMIARLVK